MWHATRKSVLRYQASAMSVAEKFVMNRHTHRQTDRHTRVTQYTTLSYG